MKNRFFKYVSQNILAMIGLSLYILADTYFISKAVGANGITALNMALPVYGVIFALGQMVGVGSAIRYSIVKKNSTGILIRMVVMNATNISQAHCFGGLL